MIPRSLSVKLQPFDLPPPAGADVAIHARHVARRGHGEGDGVLGHAGIAIAPDGVDLDAPARRRGKVDEAGSAGAEKNDVPKVRATRQQVGIEEGMVVDADVEAIEEGWQPIGLAVGDVDLNGWVFRPPYTVPELDHAGEAVQKEYRHRDRPACQRPVYQKGNAAPQRPSATCRESCQPIGGGIARSDRAERGRNTPILAGAWTVRIGRTIMGWSGWRAAVFPAF